MSTEIIIVLIVQYLAFTVAYGIAAASEYRRSKKDNMFFSPLPQEDITKRAWYLVLTPIWPIPVLYLGCKWGLNKLLPMILRGTKHLATEALPELVSDLTTITIKKPEEQEEIFSGDGKLSIKEYTSKENDNVATY